MSPVALSRRDALALGAGAALTPWLGATSASAAPPTFVYDLKPEPIADGVWLVRGATDMITAQNGGAIANVAIFDTKDGYVLLDTGPSHRYGLALAEVAHTLTGKTPARVFITHIHADHSLGATAFTPDTLYGADGLAADFKLRGDDITNAMYRVAGDWMRGTGVPEVRNIAKAGVEDIGGRRFRTAPMSGHTASDLTLFEETSGLLLTGDLVFLDRAATTPDADLTAWRASLDKLAEIPHARLVPGHGPVEPGRRGIDQTRRWLDFVESTISRHFDAGLDEPDMMAQPIPDWTKEIAVSHYEYQRSVMHLTPRLEAAKLPLVTA